MPKERICATDTGSPAKTLADCQHDAVVLSGMLEGISLMDNEGEHFGNARISVTMAAMEIAIELAADLDALQLAGLK